MSHKNKIIVAVILSTITSSVSFAALYGFGPAETWTIMKIIELTTGATTNIAAFGTAFGTSLQTKFEYILSALAVATKQEALSANVVSDGTRQAAEQLVNAVRAQKQNDLVAQSYMDYNPVSGQGYDPCGTFAKNKSLDMAFSASNQQTKEAVGSIDIAPGRLVDSSVVAMNARLQNHQENFCSDGEAESGLCRKSELPSGDTNAALLFEPASADSLTYKAKMAYIQHVLGEPDQALPKAAGQSRAGDHFMKTKLAKDSLLSIPAYSLSKIASDNTQSSEFGNKSPNEILRTRINQYFGGKEAVEWSGSMARQTHRGLMVEALKMVGLENWMLYKEYERNQRMQLNMAALVLASSLKHSEYVSDKYQKVLNDNTTLKIK